MSELQGTFKEYRNSRDRNKFWRYEPGVIQNILDEAIEHFAELEAELLGAKAELADTKQELFFKASECEGLHEIIIYHEQRNAELEARLSKTALDALVIDRENMDLSKENKRLRDALENIANGTAADGTAVPRVRLMLMKYARKALDETLK